VVIAESAEI